MIERLKKFWKEFGTKEFGIKYILPVGGLFFTWGFLGHLYTQSLTLDDFVKTTGTVEQIEIVFEQGAKSNYKWLTIHLNETGDSYRVHDSFKSRFKEFKTKISTGDTITIYTRTPLQTTIGWGQAADIYQIEKRGQVLFDFKWMKKFNKDQLWTTLFFSVFFWGIYIGLMINMNGEKKAAANKMHVP